uniref:Uncharacterized protein n=1 Tax=Arundo donax TaxID=35708 RepID=A0A0A9DC26_ARUDO
MAGANHGSAITDRKFRPCSTTVPLLLSPINWAPRATKLRFRTPHHHSCTVPMAKSPSLLCPSPRPARPPPCAISFPGESHADSSHLEHQYVTTNMPTASALHPIYHSTATASSYSSRRQASSRRLVATPLAEPGRSSVLPRPRGAVALLTGQTRPPVPRRR